MCSRAATYQFNMDTPLNNIPGRLSLTIRKDEVIYLCAIILMCCVSRGGQALVGMSEFVKLKMYLDGNFKRFCLRGKYWASVLDNLVKQNVVYVGCHKRV